MNRLKEKILFLLLLIPSLLLGNTGGSEFLVRQIRLEEGLSQSTILSIIQDKKGFLWIGTANGLNRYDGYSFKILSHDPMDSNSISDNGILSLFESKDGSLWIGTIEGVLNKYNSKDGRFYRYDIFSDQPFKRKEEKILFEFPLPFSRNNLKTITSIDEDGQGNLWIGTWDNGIICITKKTGKKIWFNKFNTDQHRIPINTIKKILIKDNILWAATLGGGIMKLTFGKSLDDYSVETYQNNPTKINSLPDNKVTDIIIDRDNKIVASTFGGGIAILPHSEQTKNAKEAKFIIHKSGLSHSVLSSDNVTALIQNRDGYYFAGTFGAGVDIIAPDFSSRYNFRNDPLNLNSLTRNDILKLFEDRNGNVWAGTHLGRGLNKIEKANKKFNQISKSPNRTNWINDDVVWALYPDKDSVLWIGTYKGGLNKFDRKNNRFIYFKKELGNINDNHIRAIEDAGDGNLLIGTYSNGLDLFSKTSGTIINYKNNPSDPRSLGANQVQSIYIDRIGTLWIGTFGGGLNYSDSFKTKKTNLKFNKFINDLNDPFSISDNRVYTIYEDRDGDFWVGTFGGGLAKFDRKNERFISYKNILGDESSIADNRVVSIFEDSYGTLWIGTYGGGLQKFDKITEKFTRMNIKNRLNSSVVYGIIEDNEKNLWMSTDNGIFKMNLVTGFFTQYVLNDGLQSLEFSGGAYGKSSSGEIFFGGISGLNYFYPEQIKDNKSIPPIVISSITVFNQPINKEPDNLVLSYGENFFTVEFAVLDYTNPIDNQYAYMLEGFDSDWNYTTSKNRMASYTNLQPGKYVFKVIGSNNDGIWNNNGALLFIEILPPFYYTWWFITISILSIGFIIYYLSTMRFRNLLSIEKLKGKLAADLHDNIGSGLTEISILSEIASNSLLRSLDDVSDNLATISDKSRMLIDSMSEIVWMINPSRDSLSDLILRLKDSYSDFLSGLAISFRVVYPESIGGLKLGVDFKQNIYLIFKEGINNAIKHSNCSKIILEVKQINNILEIELVDNGRGMDIGNTKTGNGLGNMKKRAKDLGGSIVLESSPGNGTKITLTAKLSSTNKLIKKIIKK
ncbi:MAG: ATP-binding protein [Melioribacteraceae bacterium]|nr:ATP-binding protein [Melioribacteraceae bacterium]